MIDPGFWSSYHCKRLSLRQRLLFLGLISNADDDGKLKGDAVYIKSIVFPYDEIGKGLIEEDLQSLVNEKMIRWYCAENEDDKYVKLRQWTEHQIIRKDRYVESVLPDEIEDNNQAATKRQPGSNQMSPLSKVKESKVKESNRAHGALVKWYLSEVVKLFPNKSSLKQSTIDAGVETIDKLIRIDGYSLDDVDKTLKWVVESYDVDAHFNWLPNLLSLATLRNRKETGGLTKFEKIFTQLPQSHKQPKKQYLYKCPECKDDKGVTSRSNRLSSVCGNPAHKGKQISREIVETING